MGVDTVSGVNGTARIESFGREVQSIRDALHQVIVGQENTIDQLLICALTGSHALLVGVPGLAKTLVVKALASAFTWNFSRIQFTPDLMPSDITGYELMGGGDGNGERTMIFRHGPLFANLVLADEINRATPKTQSALLEAMGERHVTVAGVTRPMQDPFLVVATQNPIEQEGTYPLPEAQLDRFMMEIHVCYPSSSEEKEIVRRTAGGTPELPESTLTRELFIELRDLVMAAPVPENVIEYVVKLCRASRQDEEAADDFVKQYEEDTNLACLSVIDCSGSMRFDGAPLESAASSWWKRTILRQMSSQMPILQGHVSQGQDGDHEQRRTLAPDKLTYAQYFTTALTYLVTRGGDQAGLALIADGLHAYHSPGSTVRHARGLYERIEAITTAPESDLAAGLDSILGQVRGRGVMLLMSDFLVSDISELTAALRRFRHRGWEIVMLHLIHPNEEQLPNGVAYQFEGLDSTKHARPQQKNCSIV